ncbi:MAG: 6-phosphogluconolactonase [Sideroxyarcus sp.]|nr:6-phosphogluconolactonase [Sideroxyarcus sp.]
MQSSQTCRWHEFNNRAPFEQAASRDILEAAQRAIEAQGAFRIVLAGGNTPRDIYRMLCHADTDWSAWHIYFGDERCLPADHPERNSSMARSVWFDHVAVPLRQIHVIPAELGPQKAAANYARELAGIAEFDLVLLGLGEDGHTASLFPGGAWEHANAWPDVLPVHDAPKPPSHRVSLSPARLSHAARVMFLASGESKHEAVMKWRAGVAIPASRICPAGGVDIFLCT